MRCIRWIVVGPQRRDDERRRHNCGRTLRVVTRTCHRCHGTDLAHDAGFPMTGGNAQLARLVALLRSGFCAVNPAGTDTFENFSWERLAAWLLARWPVGEAVEYTYGANLSRDFAAAARGGDV